MFFYYVYKEIKSGEKKLTFISSVSPYPEEEYFLGKSSWSTNVADWKQRFEVGDVVADPSGSWEPETAEAYIDQQVAVLNTNISNEILARQTTDQSLQNQINSEATTRANVDTSLQNQISTEANTRSTVDEQLRILYENLTQSDIVVGPRPSSGQLTNVIYREPDRSHTPPQNYSDYMWYNNGWVLMATYDNAIDDVPTLNSNNLVKSGGVYESIKEKADCQKVNVVFSEFSKYGLTDGRIINATETTASLCLDVVPGDHIYFNNFDRTTVSNPQYFVLCGYTRKPTIEDYGSTFVANIQPQSDDSFIIPDNVYYVLTVSLVKADVTEPVEALFVNFLHRISDYGFVENLVLKSLPKVTGLIGSFVKKYIGRFRKNTYFRFIVNSWSSSGGEWLGFFTSERWEYPVLLQLNINSVEIGKEYYFTYNGSDEFDVYLLSFNSSPVTINAELDTWGDNIDATNDAKGTVVLYEKIFNSTVDSEFINGNGKFTNNGIVIDNSSVVKFNRYYSLNRRGIRIICRFSNDAVAKLHTDQNDTICKVDVPNHKIYLNSFSADALNVNSTDLFLVELSRDFQDVVFKVTNINTSESSQLAISQDGPGGIGQGAVTDNPVDVGMQHDYYCFSTEAGTYTISKMVIVSKYCDLTLLAYGDSISEPEVYFPHADINNAWTKLIADNVKGHTIFSGRGGTQISQIMARIVNELPKIKAKYVMVTIGTNGGNTYENLSALVNYILDCGSIPILNNIPCNESNTQVSTNQVIEQVRNDFGIKGCRFDIATSLNADGASVDITKMWWENYSSTSNYYHHPNVKGSKAMFAQALIDIPEIFQ